MRVDANQPVRMQRNGKFLCSSRDPIKEAKSWLQTYAEEIAMCDRVIVIGAGAGFHLTELLNQYPDIVLEVIEADEACFKAWQESEPRFQNAQQIGLVTLATATKSQLVLDFKPAWVDFENLYQNASDSLRERNLGNIKNICEELQLDDQSQNAKIWRALREMVL